MNTIKISTTLLAILPLFVTTAPIHKCIDGLGHKTYTQSKGKNCKISNLGKASVYTSASAYSTLQQFQTAANSVSPPPVAGFAALQATRSESEQAQKDLEGGKKVRCGSERNHIHHLDRAQNLKNAVKAAEQKINSARAGNSSLAYPMIH